MNEQSKYSKAKTLISKRLEAVMEALRSETYHWENSGQIFPGHLLSV